MKKIIAILLCIILAFSSISLFAVSASAEETGKLTINVKSNVSELFPDSVSEIDADEKKVTVTYWFNTPDYNMVNSQFLLTYEREYLEYNTDEGVNQTGTASRISYLMIKSAFDDNGQPKSVTMNTNPGSYANNETLGAIKGNCTDADGYGTSDNRRKAFLSVTFNVRKAGETTVNLNLIAMGFRNINESLESEPVLLVKGGLLIKDDKGQTPVSYVTDSSYTAAYEGVYDENYVPMVSDPNLVIYTSSDLYLNLTFNFLVRKSAIGNMTNPYITIVYNDQDSRCCVNETIAGKLTDDFPDYYCFTYNGLLPQTMYNEYTVTVYASDNGIIHYNSSQRGFASYLYNGFNYPDEKKFYPLYIDLLNFGSAAQIYKGYHDDSPVNANLSNYEQLSSVVAAENHKKENLTATDYYQKQVTDDQDFPCVNNPSVKCVGVNLVLDNAIEMNYYFSADNTDGLKVVVSQYKNVEGSK